MVTVQVVDSSMNTIPDLPVVDGRGEAKGVRNVWW